MTISVKELSISIKSGTDMTNIRHNNRDLTEKEYKEPAHSHIIREKSKHNIVVQQMDIKEAYHILFDDKVEAYNTKQKRADRKIDDYYKKVRKSGTLNLQKELIVGLGAKEDWDKMSFQEKIEGGKVIEKYLEEFIEANKKNIFVYNAVIHLDEMGAPHAHVNYIPLAHGYKNGIETQPSFSKALNQMGYKGKGKFPFIQFREAEVKRMEAILNDLGIKRKLGETNKDPNVQAYKKRKDLEKDIKAKEEEVGKLDTKISEQGKALDKAKEEYQKQAQKLKQTAQEQNKALEDYKNQLEAQVKEKEAFLGEQDKVISERQEYIKGQQVDIEYNQKYIDNQIQDYNEQNSFVTKRDNALARLEQGLQKMSQPIDYEKEVGVSKVFAGKIVMGQKTFERMKEKASFFSVFGELTDTLVSAIMESPIVKRLQKEVNHWRSKYEALKDAFKEEKEDLEEEIVNLEGDINLLNKELEEYRTFENQFDKYLSKDEQEKIFKTIRDRQAKDIEKNGMDKGKENNRFLHR